MCVGSSADSKQAQLSSSQGVRDVCIYVETLMPPFHGFVQTSEQVAIGIAVEMRDDETPEIKFVPIKETGTRTRAAMVWFPELQLP